MALDKDRLGDAIADALIAKDSLTLEAADETNFRNTMKAVAQQVIDEITGNAVVSTLTDVGALTGSGPPGGPLPAVGIAASGDVA